MLIKQHLQMLLMRNKKVSFLKKLDKNARILDVGCGNNSPLKTKKVLKNCFYTGIDIDDYNQSSKELADKYIVADRLTFHQSIEKLHGQFDAVISAHNLEHCDNREGTLLAMLNALKPGGLIYLAFPCEESINFPSRKGTLNYYDDSSHLGAPPNLEWVLKHLKSNNFTIIRLAKKNRPVSVRFIGFLLEPLSSFTKKIYPGTWEYYGFETIIWAKKIS
jgi:SAM-dependent methyltransferase